MEVRLANRQDDLVVNSHFESRALRLKVNGPDLRKKIGCLYVFKQRTGIPQILELQHQVIDLAARFAIRRLWGYCKSNSFTLLNPDRTQDNATGHM